MDKLFPVCRNGEYLGTVTVRRTQSATEFYTECNALTDAVYRVIAGNISLGVLCPENGVLRARKRYSDYDLKRENADIESLNSAILEKVCDITSEWGMRRIGDIEITDDVFVNAIGNDEYVLYSDNGKRKLIATPINGEKGFLFAPAFSIAKIEVINGVKHGVLQINKKGLVSNE